MSQHPASSGHCSESTHLFLPARLAARLVQRHRRVQSVFEKDLAVVHARRLGMHRLIASVLEHKSTPVRVRRHPNAWWARHNGRHVYQIHGGRRAAVLVCLCGGAEGRRAYHVNDARGQAFGPRRQGLDLKLGAAGGQTTRQRVSSAACVQQLVLGWYKHGCQRPRTRSGGGAGRAGRRPASASGTWRVWRGADP